MSISELISALETGGPFAIVAFLGIAYYKKDQQLLLQTAKTEQLFDQLISVIEKKTISDIKLENAISGLKDVIMMMVNKQ